MYIYVNEHERAKGKLNVKFLMLKFYFKILFFFFLFVHRNDLTNVLLRHFQFIIPGLISLSPVVRPGLYNTGAKGIHTLVHPRPRPRPRPNLNPQPRTDET